jgi:hypothetical protein
VKNDQCFVEQKNGTIVRQVVGYDRLVGEEASRQLTELYRALRLYVNCFQPLMKLQAKLREGKKVRYVYDPAKTPREPPPAIRSIVCPETTRTDRGGAGARPHRSVPTTRAVATGRFPLRCRLLSFCLIPLSDPLHVFSVEQCTAGNLPEERNAPAPTAGLETLYREQERRKRVLGWRRTHKDPFEGDWNRSSPGSRPILNGAAAIFSGNCSAAPPDAISHYKSARFSAACGKYEPSCWKRGRSNGKWQ